MGDIGVMAIVMAGGKASRFPGHVEKALLTVRGRTLLERSLKALEEGGADEILVTVTDRTPRTGELAKRLGARVIRTRGLNYHDDVIELLDAYPRFVSLNVDVPFISSRHVDELMKVSPSGSAAAVIPASISMVEPDRDVVLVDSLGRKMLWVGLNIVTAEPEAALKMFEDPLLSINVNNEEDLALARRIAEERLL